MRTWHTTSGPAPTKGGIFTTGCSRTGASRLRCPIKGVWLLAVGQLAAILGDRLGVAFGNPFGSCATHLIRVLLIKLATKAKLQMFDLGQQLLPHLLDQGRVTGKSLRIAALRLAEQRIGLGC